MTMKYYAGFDKHLVALDCIIFGFDEAELKLLLLKRKFEPARGQWSLMGGFLRESESLDEAACRILNQLTGLTNIYMKQLFTFGEVDRDPGARTISVAYYALIKINETNRMLVEEHGAEWISTNHLPSLIFDHNMMVKRPWKHSSEGSRANQSALNCFPSNSPFRNYSRSTKAFSANSSTNGIFENKCLKPACSSSCTKKKNNLPNGAPSFICLITKNTISW